MTFECLEVTVGDLIDDLFLTDSASDLGDTLRQKGKRVPGSCEWLSEQDEFRRWIIDDDKLHILWLLGAPGIGKTMIASYLVEVLQKKEEGSSPATFAFYLCNDRNEGRRTTPAIVRGLLVQLLQNQPDLFAAIESDYKRHKKSIVSNLSALFSALRRLLRWSTQRIYILIDALDECEGSSRHDFFTFIEDLDQDMKVSIIITSRPEVDIEDAVGDTTDFIRIDSVKVNDDLSNFINIRVDDLKRKRKNYPSKLIEDIRDALRKQAGGTFLWVSLVLQDIASASTAKRAREKLAGLPKGLPGIYKRILENISDDDFDDAAFILRWVVATRQPLKVRELATAQAMAGDGCEGEFIPGPDTIDELADGYRVCGPLLFHDPEDDTINLVHQSAKDFLTALECPEEYRVDRDEAQLCIWSSCVDFFGLLQSETRSMLFERIGDIVQTPRPPFKGTLSTYCFLDYAFLQLDVRHSSPAFSLPMVRAFLCRCQFFKRLPQLRNHWLLSWSGHRGLAEAEGSREEFREQEEWRENRPLKICQMLVENGADITVKTSWGVTALHGAAAADNVELVLFFLGKGASIHEPENSGRTPLHTATEQGNEKVVALLLSKGADVGVRWDWGMSVLFAAAEEGHCAIARLLIEYGADPTEKDEYHGETALVLSIRYSKPLMASLLISHGADPAWKSPQTHQSLLHNAVESGDINMLRFVREIYKEADINSVAYTQPLFLLAGRMRHGHLYQDRKAPIPRPHTKATALHLAATFCGCEMVEMLLEMGADVHAKGSDGLTPLQAAASCQSNESVLSYLINNGADVEAQDDGRLTALHKASIYGNVSNIVALIEHGVDVDARDRLGWTALHHAVNSIQEKAVDTLLRLGRADPNAKATDGETPIHIVPRTSGRELGDQPSATERAIALLLLESGAGTKTTMDHGLTPLHQSAREGNEAITALYLQNGASVGDVDDSGRTPLHWAAIEGGRYTHFDPRYGMYEGVARLLLENGANVTARCNEGRTPLFEAAQRGHEDLCLLFIRRGANAFSMISTETTSQWGPDTDQLRSAIISYMDTAESGCGIDDHPGQTDDEEGESDFDKYSKTRRFPPGTIKALDLLFEMVASFQPSKEQFLRAVDQECSLPTSLLPREGSSWCNEESFATTALTIAVERGYAGIVKAMLGDMTDARLKETHLSAALHTAVASGCTEMVQDLVGEGADVNYKWEWEVDNPRSSGWSHSRALDALARATEVLLPSSLRVRPLTPLILAAAAGYISTAKVLIDLGANMDADSDLFGSPSYCARNSGNAQMAGFFMEYFRRRHNVPKSSYY